VAVVGVVGVVDLDGVVAAGQVAQAHTVADEVAHPGFEVDAAVPVDAGDGEGEGERSG
jgi:hypothetical protein